jgi:hypothetical protein
MFAVSRVNQSDIEADQNPLKAALFWFHHLGLLLLHRGSLCRMHQ